MARNPNQFFRNPMMQQQAVPVPGAKTKKYQMDKKVYVRLGMTHLLKTQWYWVFVPVGIIVLNIILNVTKVYTNWWIYLIAFLVALGYVLFWAIQFTGISQLEQYKVMFDKFSYDINTKQINAMINAKEGMQIGWDMVKDVYKEKDAYTLVLSRGQFIHLPFNIFNSDNDLKFFERILRQKNLIK
ncbi:YcxB family protein [Cytophagaceae bacterium DM2B3-1]|uniref:YcxB family protein n=1 Tax=Xanthocytophaga flava TaxID=3048013 RepID=A0AAE3QT12_9BACT|nr:YcxB family protein [Xanthocytophaga flavus]MDJ1471654.1 YcxB family protein [Xanthocytophaga flavus]MDJ1482153.1 YcxB family protein [Xanthocytophaga flavus]MDJ1491699.1 YcxB family protein [Xanthocytophaga flavus]